MIVFLCHASEDKPKVRELYERLTTDKWTPWLDEKDLLAGQNWDEEISRAVKASGVVLVCLSQKAIGKTGYLQKEIKYALDAADERPPGAIYLIPALLESCEVPQRLSQWHYVKLYEPDGYAKLTKSLSHRAKDLGWERTVAEPDAIQFYSCFISYNLRDDDFARRLHGRMRDARLRVWFAPEDIKGGKKLHEQIESAIRIYDKLVIVLSDASLQSEWVMTELRRAFQAERQSSKRKLFPVRLVDFETLRNWECFDADSGKDLAVELREYFIPDFSNWKDHDQFEAAFARLLKDLRAEERAK